MKSDKNASVCGMLPVKDGNNEWCDESSADYSGALNSDDDLYGHTDYMKNVKGVSDAWKRDKYNVFDANAGEYMCFVMAVFPATSGDDKKTNSAGDGNWRVSAPQCKKIAKKPSVVILGGDMYTSGSGQTNDSIKQQLYKVAGHDQYKLYGREGEVTNGSWVEEGIVALGRVTKLSSGASTGLKSSSESGSDGRLSGAKNDKGFCESRVPLSFANNNADMVFTYYICPDYEAIGNSEIPIVTKNREALAGYWGNGEAISGAIYLQSDDGNVASATGKNIKIYNISNDIVITGGSLAKNTTRVVKAKNSTVTIKGNITYSSGTVTSSGETPKAIIYANNINIDCSVNRIDAILVAENTVTTCDGYTGNKNINSEARANQLTINGVIISNNIDLGRTYGNTIGNGSGTPAEVINYDSSTLLWGRFMAGSGESDTMTVTYQHELAPRY